MQAKCTVKLSKFTLPLYRGDFSALSFVYSLIIQFLLDVQPYTEFENTAPTLAILAIHLPSSLAPSQFILNILQHYPALRSISDQYQHV